MDKSIGAMKFQRGLITFVKYAFLLFAAVVALVPIVSCVIAAFKTVEEYQNTNVMVLPQSWTYFENFKTAWQQADMGSAFLNSFFIVICVLVGSVFISAMLPTFSIASSSRATGSFATSL